MPKLIAVEVADFLVKRYLAKGKKFTRFSLNKALYVIQGYSLGYLHRPLFDEEIEAWEHGPVVPSVYCAYGEFKQRREISKPLEVVPSQKMTPEDVRVIFDAMSFYDSFDNRFGEIYDFAHDQDGPWRKNYRPGARGVVIPKSDLEDYYEFQLNDRSSIRYSSRVLANIPKATRVRSFSAECVEAE